MSTEALQKILDLTQEFGRAAGLVSHSSTRASPHLALPPLNLPPTPDLALKLKAARISPIVSDRLQQVFSKHVSGFRSSVIEAYHRLGPTLLASLSSIDEILERAPEEPSSLLASLVQACAQSFQAGVSRLQSVVEREIACRALAVSRPKATAGFSKAAVETLRRIYLINSYPNSAEIRAIADRIAMDYKQVRVWFQNRRNRKEPSARGLQEELRIAQEHGLVPSKQLLEQAKKLAIADASARKTTTARRITSSKRIAPPSKKTATPVRWVPNDDNESTSGDGMDIDGEESQSPPRPTAPDSHTFHYDDASSLGYGRPPYSTCPPGGGTISPEAHSSSSSLSYSHPSSSSLQAPTDSWQDMAPSSIQTASPDDQWKLIPPQPDYYAYQAQLDGSLVPPQPQRAASYGSTASSPGMSDLDSLWSIASLDPSTTYSTFASAPCVPTDLDFDPPAPSDELTLAYSDQAYDPLDYLLTSTVPPFSFSPTPPPPCEPTMDFTSAEAFQALLDSSSGDGVEGEVTGGLLWGSGSNVLELSEEIDQVIREFTPEGGVDCGGYLFDFNIPPPATEAW